MISLQKFVFSSFQENTYLLWDDDSKDAMIIDPGCLEIYEQKELSEFIKSKSLVPKFLINTHCHIDHIFGNAFVKSEFDIPLYIPEKDELLLRNMSEQCKLFGIDAEDSPLPDHYLSEELKLNLGNSEVSFIFTPGHTPGEFCVYLEKENILISGDVLFAEGIGRTDLWGGNYNTLLNSIRNKLLVLPDETVVYPGHGDKTFIGHEKKYNPFLV